MKTTLPLIIALLSFYGAFGQIVNIPDANFKALLLNITTINTNGDAEIQVTEAQSFTGTLNCSNANIVDVTGIEAFTSLPLFKCSENAITSLDLSQNVSLETLICDDNALTSLDLSQNVNLKLLYAHKNNLSSIDLSSNLLLTHILLQNNQLSQITINQNNIIKVLNCDNNLFSNIDVTTLDSLLVLRLDNNLLVDVDITQNAELNYLRCKGNQLVSLDVSNNLKLAKLFCDSNSLSALDLSPNLDLIELYCSNNSLNALDISNGTNTSITNFDATNNPNLTCIQVDDATYSTTNWTNIDATASFSLACTFCFDSYLSIDTSICSGETYIGPNLTSYSATGIYYDTLVNNCGGDSIITIDLLVNVVDSVQLGPEEFCAGTSVDFYGTTITSSGTYHHTLVNQNGCDSIVSKTFTVLENTITNNNGTLEATSGFDTYQWFESGLSIASANTITFTPTESGNYSCEAIKNTCISMSNSISIVIDTTGTAIRQMVFNDLQVYPNPTKDVFQLSLNEELSSIRMYDTFGKLVKEFNAKSTLIDVSDLTAGVYFLEIANAEKRSTIKIVKQ